MNLGRIIVQGKEAAYVGEQLQAGGGLRLFSRKDPVKRQQGLVCPSAACGPGDGQQGHESAKARAAKGGNPGIGEILRGQIATVEYRGVRSVGVAGVDRLSVSLQIQHIGHSAGLPVCQASVQRVLAVTTPASRGILLS